MTLVQIYQETILALKEAAAASTIDDSILDELSLVAAGVADTRDILGVRMGDLVMTKFYAKPLEERIAFFDALA